MELMTFTEIVTEQEAEYLLRKLKEKRENEASRKVISEAFEIIKKSLDVIEANGGRVFCGTHPINYSYNLELKNLQPIT
jgi:translation elongation factor EF-1alpha